MKKRRLIWRIFPSHLVVLILSLTAVTWLASSAFRNFYLKQISDDLEARAHLVQNQIKPLLIPLDQEEIDRLCKAWGKSSATRITVILPSGKVVGDSLENPDRMESHSTRQEVVAVKEGGAGRSIRFSRTLEKNMMYVAIPLSHQGKLTAVLRTSIPIASVENQLAPIWGRLAVSAVLIVLVAGGISLFIARRISRPIEEMKSGAIRFAKGNMGKLQVPDTEELGGLAEAMNHMAGELDNRIKTIVRQRNELETVLSSMVEGVMAVDMDERIMSMNVSALKMFDVDPETCRGRTIQEVIRNSALIRFIGKAVSGQEVMEEDIVFFQQEERVLSVRNSPIFDAAEKKMGVLVVVEDVTKMRQLENMRKDFVANVSHEIRTPLTTIKGFVETLRHETDLDSEKAKRFLEIILRHVDRLNDIIEDLLSLAKIEREKEIGAIDLSDGNVREVIATAVGLCRPRADEKKITVETQMPESLGASMDAVLLEQAIVNLLDNAVKYSSEGSSVAIRAKLSGPNVVITITDHGTGISDEHLPRLFERFYRVDKARSRKLGGTGLGLAIVKHIMEAHKGTVKVESTMGKGSTFILQFPQYGR